MQEKFKTFRRQMFRKNNKIRLKRVVYSSCFASLIGPENPPIPVERSPCKTCEFEHFGWRRRYRLAHFETCTDVCMTGSDLLPGIEEISTASA